MATVQQMREAVENKTAQILTLEAAKALKGKRIATIYFGYRGQDGIDEFIVGEVKREIYGNGTEGRICIFTEEGRNTYIRAHEENNGLFSCSDVDRFVYFIELPTFVITHANCGNYGNLRLELVRFDKIQYQEHDNVPYDTYLLKYPDGRIEGFSRNTFEYEK